MRAARAMFRRMLTLIYNFSAEITRVDVFNEHVAANK